MIPNGVLFYKTGVNFSIGLQKILRKLVAGCYHFSFILSYFGNFAIRREFQFSPNMCMVRWYNIIIEAITSTGLLIPTTTTPFEKYSCNRVL